MAEKQLVVRAIVRAVLENVARKPDHLHVPQAVTDYVTQKTATHLARRCTRSGSQSASTVASESRPDDFTPAPSDLACSVDDVLKDLESSLMGGDVVAAPPPALQTSSISGEMDSVSIAVFGGDVSASLAASQTSSISGELKQNMLAQKAEDAREIIPLRPSEPQTSATSGDLEQQMLAPKAEGDVVPPAASLAPKTSSTSGEPQQQMLAAAPEAEVSLRSPPNHSQLLDQVQQQLNGEEQVEVDQKHDPTLEDDIAEVSSHEADTCAHPEPGSKFLSSRESCSLTPSTDASEKEQTAGGLQHALDQEAYRQGGSKGEYTSATPGNEQGFHSLELDGLGLDGLGSADIALQLVNEEAERGLDISGVWLMTTDKGWTFEYAWHHTSAACTFHGVQLKINGDWDVRRPMVKGEITHAGAIKWTVCETFCVGQLSAKAVCDGSYYRVGELGTPLGKFTGKCLKAGVEFATLATKLAPRPDASLAQGCSRSTSRSWSRFCCCFKSRSVAVPRPGEPPPDEDYDDDG